MFSSTSENNGFAAIGQDELENVNGGFDPFSVAAGVFVLGYTIYKIATDGK